MFSSPPFLFLSTSNTPGYHPCYFNLHFRIYCLHSPLYPVTWKALTIRIMKWDPGWTKGPWALLGSWEWPWAHRSASPGCFVTCEATSQDCKVVKNELWSRPLLGLDPPVLSLTGTTVLQTHHGNTQCLTAGGICSHVRRPAGRLWFCQPGMDATGRRGLKLPIG